MAILLIFTKSKAKTYYSNLKCEGKSNSLQAWTSP